MRHKLRMGVGIVLAAAGLLGTIKQNSWINESKRDLANLQQQIRVLEQNRPNDNIIRVGEMPQHIKIAIHIGV